MYLFIIFVCVFVVSIMSDQIAYGIDIEISMSMPMANVYCTLNQTLNKVLYCIVL